MPLATLATVAAFTAAMAFSGPAAFAQAAESAGPQDYRLGVADKVRILVFNEPTLSGEFLVGASGALSLPLIGEVPAGGDTSRALSRRIEAKLADGYLRDPKVSVEVLTFRPFYILGEVNKPGEYPYSTSLNVLNAVATAGGFTYRADKRHVYVKAVGDTAERKEDLSPTIAVEPGETIRIGERYF